MLEINDLSFFGAEALLYRLTNGLQNTNREVVFVVGAPLTASYGDTQGVDDVNSVVRLIREEFLSDSDTTRRFETALNSADNRYQAAFSFLHGHKGQDAANQVIRKAVLNAHNGYRKDRNFIASWPDPQLATLEAEPKQWNLSPAVSALGELLSLKGVPFSQLVITSNFDPLIEVAISAAGGSSWRTSLHSDGDFNQSHAPGCQVLHIHGFWQGGDTLHTGNQLLQRRPFLKNSLLHVLQDKLVVVIGYGGWQDIFTGALESLVSNTSAYPEVLWSFYEQAPDLNPFLRSVLRPGIDRNRVTLYSGVDCNSFFPELLTKWESLRGTTSQSVTVNAKLPTLTPVRLRPAESDRPPSIEVWVGREAELRTLESSAAKVVILSGIGGQGKSTLAAQYLQLVSSGATQFTQWDWRDCKEQGDRIRTQLIAAIERMTADDVFASSLGTASDADIVETFIRFAEPLKCVFVFDNVDGYVDLEKERFVGILDRLVQAFARTKSNSRIIITCRPKATYDLISVISIILEGLGLEEAIELFDKRVSPSAISREDISAAHNVTDGHAFWLDMMAVQVGRAPGTTLINLLDDIRRGRGGPTGLLSSIWDTLPERERIVLRAMAETMRPEDEDMIAQVVSARLNYKNFNRALRSLINLNLIVVKPERNSPDLYDLHPLVRQFVRMTFERPERVGFIKIVLTQYGNIIKGLGDVLGVHLPFPLLERWSQKAELEIEAGLTSEALRTLSAADDALIGGGHTEEFVRVARKLFQRTDWVSLSSTPEFDGVCTILISCLNGLEQFGDADDILTRYEQTVSAKTARYIQFCDVKAYSHWQRKEFDQAIEWASKGVELKEASQVDTTFDCSHTLALANRDGGNPEKALDYFRKNFTIEQIVDPADENIAEATLLGNVGRCLQMIGRRDDALICFRKSMKLLEADQTLHRLSNLAFAREWIGDAFAESDRKIEAFVFFADAEELISKAIPARARQLQTKIEGLYPDAHRPSLTQREIRRRVDQWIKSSSSPLQVVA
jgi:tetratricopeptide (TPR) repeat protein